MTYETYHSANKSALIHEYFELTFSNSVIPFQSTILPIAKPTISFGQKGKLEAKTAENDYNLEGFVLTGQFFRSYNIEANEAYEGVGIVLHPTTLYKLLNKDISKLSHKHLSLKSVSRPLYDAVATVLDSESNGREALLAYEKALKILVKSKDVNIKEIDQAVNVIIKKKGLISVKQLIKDMAISQKTLESKFKKMVGLTPGRFIKLTRFLNLMQKYENQDINLKTLIFKYNYYDEAHFYKDFKLFMNDTPKNFFKKDNEFLKKYIKR
ncbi:MULTISPECIES: helix-turn-helix domain-containing protein [Bizionia]|nr:MULTISPECIES: helix-turn-helix domain-containing protein [Bizionia]